MNTLNPKLLHGFDQKPLLERLELVYEHQDDLFDAGLLDKAVKHFEEEFTLLEIEEFQKSDIKESKKIRFEELLRGLKTLSANINKIRERNRQRAEAEQTQKEKMNLIMSRIEIWEEKIQHLIVELKNKLNRREEVDLPKYWDVFNELKTNQPDSPHIKKLKDWKDFLNQIPEYQKIEFEKKEKIKKSVENENKNKKRKEKVWRFTKKHSWKVILAIAIAVSPHFYKKFSDWRENKKSIERSTAANEYKKYTREKVVSISEKFIRLISIQKNIKKEDLTFFHSSLMNLNDFLRADSKLNISGVNNISLSGAEQYPSDIEKILVAIQKNRQNILKEIKPNHYADNIFENLSNAYRLIAFVKVNDWFAQRSSQIRNWDFSNRADNNEYFENLKTARLFSEAIQSNLSRTHELNMIKIMEEMPEVTKKEKLEAEKKHQETIQSMAVTHLENEYIESLKNKNLSELSQLFYSVLYQSHFIKIKATGSVYYKALYERISQLENLADYQLLLNEMKKIETHREKMISLQMYFDQKDGQNRSKSYIENVYDFLLAFYYQGILNRMKHHQPLDKELEAKVKKYWNKVESSRIIPSTQIYELKDSAGQAKATHDLNFGFSIK